jgi:hypothetical protein
MDRGDVRRSVFGQHARALDAAAGERSAALAAEIRSPWPLRARFISMSSLCPARLTSVASPGGSGRQQHPLHRGDLALVARQRGVEARAGTDAKLGEHLVQVPFDGARAQEQPAADFRVRESVAREPGDLVLLGSERVAWLDGAVSER